MSPLMCVKSEVKYIKAFAVPLTFEKQTVKYENDTILKDESKNAMNSVIPAVQTLVSKLLSNSATINNSCDDEELEKKGPLLKI